MYWPEVDFKFLEIAKFGPLLAQKRQNWGKFFYLQTPKKGVFWPFLALLLGTPSQALKILTVLGCLEKVYQVSRPGKANQPLFWAFSVKRMILYNKNERLKWTCNSFLRKRLYRFWLFLVSDKPNSPCFTQDFKRGVDLVCSSWSRGRGFDPALIHCDMYKGSISHRQMA